MTATSATDYLSDQGLANIEALVARAAQDFTLDLNVYAKTVQATLRFETPASVMDRADGVHALIEAAMCTDTLCKNLRAERSPERFYVDSTAAWREVADRHIEDEGAIGTLARALVTLVDAYEHARTVAP